MDLIKVEFKDDQWLETDLIEGHDSFIWTSRFIPAGDFEYKTYKVNEVYNLIKRGDYVKADGADDEVMIVDSVLIEETEQGDMLTIKGRSFETILETRASHTGSGRIWEGWGAEPWPAYAVMALIINASIRTPEQPQDEIPKTNVTFLINGAGELPTDRPSFDPKKLNVYQNLLDIMTASGIGIYAAHTGRFPDSDLYFVIHTGADRTIYQDNVDPVIMSVDAEHITNARSLSDNTKYRNVAYVNSPIGFYIWPPSSASLTGAERRVLQVNATDLTEIPEGMTATQALAARGASELAQWNDKILFDGKVADPAPIKYGRDYAMGDRITVIGKYGAPATMQVTEYIRSSTAAGYLEYPTLTQVI